MGLAAACVLSACASGMNIEDAVPAGALPTGPVNTGTYPDLNIPTQSAAEQLSGRERLLTTRSLSEARSSHARQRRTNASQRPSHMAELEALRAQHIEDALREIEATAAPAEE